jgi:hypothetical protein
LEGETLFADDHLNIKTGTTQSNEQVPAVALGVTGLEAMMTQARLTTSDEGRFINTQGSKLCIHPNLEHQAYVLLNTEFEVGSGNNDRSTVVSTRSGLTPVSVPYKASTTSWSIHAPAGQNSLTWNDRSSVEFSSAVDSDSKDMKFYVMYRASVMFSEWRGNWGSNF